MGLRGRRWEAGRNVPELFADFGHQLDFPPPSTVPASESQLFTEMVPRRGLRQPGAGWAPVLAPLSVWQMTSEQSGGVWPLIASDTLPPTGALIGIDWLSGSGFHADPIGWTLTGAAGVTNPNMIFFGAPGQGKSATVKMFCLRQMAFGYRTLILGDVKD